MKTTLRKGVDTRSPSEKMKHIDKIVVGLILAIGLLGAFHFGGRWHVLRKLERDPRARHRMSIVPTELNLSSVQATNGVVCDLGYAEFIVPSSEEIRLRRCATGLGIQGEVKHLSFFFLPPIYPSKIEPQTRRVAEAYARLPRKTPWRPQGMLEDMTETDFMLYVERVTPIPKWKAVLQGRSTFAAYVALLGYKGSYVGVGMHSVRSFETADCRGYVRVGQSSGDTNFAHVVIENHAQSLGVGFYISVSEPATEDVISDLLSILKTFRFTMPDFATEEVIDARMTQAGIVK